MAENRTGCHPLRRCKWAGEDPLMIAYHDEEWGRPVHDDIRHFEMLNLEGAQAGLSWSTILKKRANYLRLFEGFDPVRCARLSDARLEELLLDAGIVRNRLKVYGVRKNAFAFLALQAEFGSFDDYVWRFVGGSPMVNRFKTQSDLPATTPESDTLAKDLKKRGFTFVGSTIAYAYMQAAGLVDDHTIDCFRSR
jgi:DNA-3-methyladenine glycosylase I